MNQNMKQQIYANIADSITEKIKNGFYKPDEKLPSERELSAYYDVSVSTIQKALKTLIGQNYIYSVERLGYYVMPPKPNEYIFYYEDNILSDNSTIKEISKPAIFLNDSELVELLGIKLNAILYRKYKIRSKTLIQYMEHYVFVQKHSLASLSRKIDSQSILENIEKYSAKHSIEVSSEYLYESGIQNISIKVDKPFFLITKKSYDQYGKLISYLKNYYEFNEFKLDAASEF